MNAKEFMVHLESLCACNDAKEWANGKSWKEVYDTCHRGDWLLWLFRRSKGYDFQKLALAKGFCANTVRHLMRDERSLKAVDAAIAFGRGEINIDELAAAAYASAAAYADTDYTAGAAAAYADADYTAGAAAAYAAYTAADADYTAGAAAAYAAYTAAYADYTAGAAAAYADAAAAAYTAAAAAYTAAYDAKKENQQKTADIVREILPFEIWEL